MYSLRSSLRFLGVLALALAVRLLGAASRPIWYDEAFSILFSEKGPAAMMYGTLAATGSGSADIHPLAYYTTLWLWMKVFGESLVAVRMLSVLAGMGVVCLVYIIGRGLFGESTGMLAMLFAALAPFQVHYAQEIRMYSFMALWLLLSTYAYMQGTRTRRSRWWVVFAVSSALAQYTQNLSAFYLVILAASPLFSRDWKSLKATCLSGLAALVLYLPWLVQLPAQVAKVVHSYWVTRPDLYRLFTLVMVFTTNLPVPNSWLPAALFIALLLVAVGLLQSIRAFRRGGAGAGLWILYLSFGPPLLLFLFSQWKPVYIERALVPSGAAFAVWLAWVVTQTRLPAPVRTTIFVSLAAASVMGLYEHLAYTGFPYGPFRDLDSALEQRLAPGDVIVHSNKLSLLPAIYYDRALPQLYIGDPPGSPEDTLAPATQQVLGVRAEPDITRAAQGARRVWYIIYQTSIDELRAQGETTAPDLQYLNMHYVLAGKETWDGLDVYQFVTPP